MKTYFTNQFKYDRFANERILEAIIKASRPEKAVQLMAHILAAQQVWLTRCLGLPPLEIELWPAIDGNADGFADRITDNAQNWIAYVNGLTEPDFDRMVAYQNTKGQGFETKLTDILAHTINHGTHHRAQIGQSLKQAGYSELPPTDYILYVRYFN